MIQLQLIFEDEHYLAINKPAGVLVHKTPLERDPDALFAVQLLEQQLGYKVYPMHRIDRPTSGILLFAKNAMAASLLQPQFSGNGMQKYYLAIARGFMPEKHGEINQPLAKDMEFELQEAKTEYWELNTVEIPYASSERYPTSRYALVKIYPQTGRMHQIRRHFAHLRHYIIGDTTHGDNRQNHFFDSQFKLRNMLLHAWQLNFKHPYSGSTIAIVAPLPAYFENTMKQLGWAVDELTCHEF